MDWASGHWPGIMHMCVWMREYCLGWGVVLWVRGNRHHGHRRQGPRGPLCPPSEGTHGSTPPDRPRLHRRTVHPPAKQPDTQMAAARSLAVHLLAWGRRNYINSSVVSVTKDWSSDLWDYTLLYCTVLCSTVLCSTLLCSSALSTTPLYCVLLYSTVYYLTLLYCHLYSHPASHTSFFTIVLYSPPCCLFSFSRTLLCSMHTPHCQLWTHTHTHTHCAHIQADTQMQLLKKVSDAPHNNNNNHKAKHPLCSKSLWAADSHYTDHRKSVTDERICLYASLRCCCRINKFPV